MPNATQPLPWLITAGQPSEADMLAAHTAGVRTILDIRDPMEPRPLDEPGVVNRLGMEYINLPVVAGALSDELMERILVVLRRHAGTPTILHCAGANRVGGPLIAYCMLEGGMDEAAAVQLAVRGGLRSVELMEWGVDFARRKAAEPGPE